MVGREHILDELRRDVAALETIKKSLNQLEVRNEERLASYPDPEIEAHRKHLQEVIMLEAKKVEGMITGTAGEVDEAVNKVPFCEGCKHIGVNPESGPCALCFEGMMHESNKAVLPLDNVPEPVENTTVADVDEKPSSLIETAKEFVTEMVPTTHSAPQYAACLLCVNILNESICDTCNKFDKFTAKILPPCYQIHG